MKIETQKRLEEELKSGKYCYETLKSLSYLDFLKKKDVNRLFEIYLQEEIDSVDELFEAFTHKHIEKLEFYQFVMSHIDDFKISSEVLTEQAIETPEQLLRNDVARATGKIISTLFMKGFIDGKQKFVDMAKAITRNGRVLEVGSGTSLPISSLLFARDLGEVASMDHFNNNWDSLDFFKKLNVNAISEYFTKDTNIEDYDTIVGQHPCDAIIPIVERLANSDERDYFIDMCDCAAPSGGLNEFVAYLSGKDSRLQSVAIKRQPLTRKYEYHLNGVPDNCLSSDTVYITNSTMHPDDILAKVIEIDGRDRF